MLMIRLQRVGRRNHAEFRVVVTEKTRAAKSSNYVELVGHYNPHTNEVKFEEDRIKHWMENGAQVSDTVNNLLVREKVIKGKKINVLPKKSPIIKEDESKDENKEVEAKPDTSKEKKDEKSVEDKKEDDESATSEAVEEKKDEPVEKKEE